jgi:hypothetical protein
VPALARTQSVITMSDLHAWCRGGALADGVAVVLRWQGFPLKLERVVGVAPGKERQPKAHRNGGLTVRAESGRCSSS